MVLGEQASKRVWWHIRTMRYNRDGLFYTIEDVVDNDIYRIVQLGIWDKIEFNFTAFEK